MKMVKVTVLNATLGSVCVLLIFLMKLSAGLPLQSETNAKTLMYKNENDAEGNYEYGFKTDNNISVKQTGRIKHTDEGVDVIVVEGSYSYQTDDNKIIVVNYIADENGFRQNSTVTDNLEADLINIRVSTDLLASLVGGMG